MFNRPDYSEIIPGLFLGNIEATKDKIFLYRNNIHYILSLTRNPVRFDKKDKIVHIQIPLRDAAFEDIISYFDIIHGFINKGLNQGVGVYVHCDMGISRSSTAIISYLMKIWKKPYSYVRLFVKTKRPQINPNFGFQAQLMLFDKMNYQLQGPTKYHSLYQRFTLEDCLNGEKRFDVRNYLKFLQNQQDYGTAARIPVVPFTGGSNTTTAYPTLAKVEYSTVNDPNYYLPPQIRKKYHWPKLY